MLVDECDESEILVDNGVVANEVDGLEVDVIDEIIVDVLDEDDDELNDIDVMLLVILRQVIDEVEHFDIDEDEVDMLILLILLVEHIDVVDDEIEVIQVMLDVLLQLAEVEVDEVDGMGQGTIPLELELNEYQKYVTLLTEVIDLQQQLEVILVV